MHERMKELILGIPNDHDRYETNTKFKSNLQRFYAILSANFG